MIQQLAPPPIEKPSKKNAQKHYRVAEVDLPANEFSGRLIHDVSELERLMPAWNRLLETSIHANPFFHPNFLIPAISHLGDKNVSILAIESPQRMNKEGTPVLCALVPMIRRNIYGFPLSCMEVWKHDLCFDGTPLIRRDCAEATLDFMLEFVGNALKTSLLSFDTVLAEGPLAKLLINNFHQNHRTVFYRDQFTRACFQPMDCAETFINTKVAKSTRKGTQRLRRKLEKQGAVETDFLTNYSPELIDEFLALEAAGWKGNDGTALKCKDSTRKFFHEMSRRMLDSGNMVITRTSLDDRPIAMLCDFQHDAQGAQFKIAFDESLQDYSPGLILEFDTVKRLHNTDMKFIDSCADPNHSMINRVWQDRVSYQSLVIALRGQLSQFAVSSMPLIQQTKKLFQKNRRTK